jgi:hypothetical protein
VGVQRKILAEEVNPDLTKVPQTWCLYKEVQGFYEQGLRVPDDVTLLWAEDNWGNVRRLPAPEERKRSGGAGIYYHFDYHGGPRSYQWINTSPIPKIWDQLSLAKQYGADRIWIVNVGHFKGYEFPIEYFMHLAWNTDRWTNENLNEYTRLWAEREFGPTYAADIADLVSRYTKYNGRRKPELLDANTYSVINYQEADRVVASYKFSAAKAEEIYNHLPPEARDAFYELVLFPVKAGAQLNDMYFAAARNALYARQGRVSANVMAETTRSLFQAQTNLMSEFNHTFANGKWSHFMDQTHIGYTSWNDPPQNSMRAIRLTDVEVRDTVAMGVAVEGSDAAWPGAEGEAALPMFDSLHQQGHYIEIFPKGQRAFAFEAAASDPWISVSATNGMIEKDKRIWITVNWDKVPKGTANGSVTIAGVGADPSGELRTNVTVKVAAFNPTEVTRDSLQGFAEGEGCVSIEAEHYTKKTDAGANRWIRIENYGRTLSAMRSAAPVDAMATPGKDSPCLEYQMYVFKTGQVEVETTVSPTLNFIPGRALRLAVSFDDETPQTITIVPANYTAQNGNRDWEASVRDGCRKVKSTHTLEKAGYHTLKIWMVDPAVAVEKIVVNTGGVKQSYLGPPESYHLFRDAGGSASKN